MRVRRLRSVEQDRLGGITDELSGPRVADRSSGVNPLDKVSYVKFKSAILLTSKALAYLGKLKQKAAS